MLPRWRQLHLAPIPALAFLAFLATFTSVLASTSQADPPSSEDSELICRTDNPSECYPKIFRPTHEFQKVHDDQDLPAGLHVRLNIYTGEKEAKINNPNEEDPALEGLPVDRAVVLVDPEPAETAVLPSGAPAYESIGAIKAPTDESRVFYDALANLKRGVPKKNLFSLSQANESQYDEALDTLEEFSHDIYYGLKIAQDREATRSLLCLMSTEDVFLVDRGEAVVSRAQQAAAVIAAALQNNPSALSALEEAWGAHSTTNCSCDGKPVELRSLVFGAFFGPEHVTADNIREAAPALIKARLSAVNGLVKSERIKRDFLSSGGMSQILRILLHDGPEYETVRVKAANLVKDTFLDDSMGATLGLWPTKEPGSSDKCGKEEGPETEECWDYHMEQLAERHKAEESHWSGELWRMLTQQRRAGSPKGRTRDEL